MMQEHAAVLSRMLVDGWRWWQAQLEQELTEVSGVVLPAIINISMVGIDGSFGSKGGE